MSIGHKTLFRGFVASSGRRFPPFTMASPSPLATTNLPSPATIISNSTRLRSRLSAVDCLLRNLNRSHGGSSRSSSSTPLPLHLQEPYEALYKELEHALLQGRNGSAFLFGPPACGKSIVLDAVLAKLANVAAAASSTAESSLTTTPLFRKVVIDGRILPGHATGRVVHEILRQLTESALPAATTHAHESSDDAPKSKRRKKSSSRSHLLRLRSKGSFLSHMDLLNQILQIAAMDNVPILIVLKHLETFVGSVAGGGWNMKPTSNSSSNNSNNNPQLLLYHLLDRIGQADCGLALVGTSRHSGVLGLLEKRIQSRVHGSTKCIHFGACSGNWNKSHVQVMLLEKLVHVNRFDKLTTGNGDSLEGNASAQMDEEDEDDEATELSKEIGAVLVADSSQQESSAEIDYKDDSVKVRATLQRALSTGRDVRWFLRVASLALSMYREDCRRAMAAQESSVALVDVCVHTPRYWLHALQDMGATLVTDSGQFDPCRTARMQVLTDLNGPQVALILSARRILSRDSQKSDDILIVLTLERMLLEYRRYQGTPNRYSTPVLRRAFHDLLSLGVIRPAMDHAGTGPFQYQHMAIQWDVHTMARVPLHLTFDVRAELTLALDRNMFPVASTALMEWAKKIS
ncbi:hypothetical protein MPSEU_000757900 [Mayamaea pseudoterrestris]|nr:hypothetical protein MPSEU_000757900 [Mayamaea pseudoterrestris]